MIKVYKETKIYVLCPAYVKTGGPELLHQLVNKLTAKGINAYIVYTGTKEENKDYTADDFKCYNTKNILEEQIEDKEENVLIIPEIQVKSINKFKYIRKAIWWLSVDNYTKNYTFISSMKLCGIKYAIKLLLNGTIVFHKNDYKKARYNLCQSYYSMCFLKKKNVKNIMYLSDYINRTFMNENKEKHKKNKVLYNPKKGYRFTKKIINKSPYIDWVPIKNLTTEQVKELLLESKVYIDFGNHPGKDRFPREAAICDCCIITGKRGSAKYYEDVKIPDEFKFYDNKKNIPLILSKINECLSDYENQKNKYKIYKEFIRNEEKDFEDDIEKIFIKE